MKRAVVKIEFGLTPKDIKVTLDDGSELTGLRDVETRGGVHQINTFTITGFIVAPRPQA